jgi:sulfoxide reductase heme-binding subunit YedZ
MGKTGVNPLLVLDANLMFDVAIRPAWWVLTAAAAIIAAHLVAQWLWPKPAPRQRPSSAAKLPLQIGGETVERARG